MTSITPLAWRKAMAVARGKHGSRLRASELLPAYAERWRRKRDDGRAETALLAMWGLTHLPNMGARVALPIAAGDLAALAF